VFLACPSGLLLPVQFFLRWVHVCLFEIINVCVVYWLEFLISFVCLFYVLDLQDQLREELEMDPNLPAVLLMGGGEGMGPVKKTALALGESLFDKELGKPIGQLIIICGRNKTLVSTLENEQWKIPVKVMAFLNLSAPRQYLYFEHPLNAFSSLM
jgi:hypothetical protein